MLASEAQHDFAKPHLFASSARAALRDRVELQPESRQTRTAPRPGSRCCRGSMYTGPQIKHSARTNRVPAHMYTRKSSVTSKRARGGAFVEHHAAAGQLFVHAPDDALLDKVRQHDARRVARAVGARREQRELERARAL